MSLEYLRRKWDFLQIELQKRNIFPRNHCIVKNQLVKRTMPFVDKIGQTISQVKTLYKGGLGLLLTATPISASTLQNHINSNYFLGWMSKDIRMTSLHIRSCSIIFDFILKFAEVLPSPGKRYGKASENTMFSVMSCLLSWMKGFPKCFRRLWAEASWLTR